MAPFMTPPASRLAALRLCLAAGLPWMAGGPAAAQVAAPAPAPTPATAAASAPAGTLFAVEIQTGPGWDTAKPAHEQAHFREHSAHLRRLREQGLLLMGARYADKGLLVLRVAGEEQARALMQEDPSIQAGVFRYTLNEFRVFYGGTLAPPPRPR